MVDPAENKVIQKYQIQYRHPDSLSSGQFNLNGVIYEFIWQHYDYQYLIYPVTNPNIRYTICIEPNELTTELFFSVLQEMISTNKYHKTI